MTVLICLKTIFIRRNIYESTPNSRVKIIVTQGIYALGSIVIMFSALFGLGVVICRLIRSDRIGSWQ